MAGCFRESCDLDKVCDLPCTTQNFPLTYSYDHSIETNCVIIAACIPMLLPFLELLFGKRLLSAPPPSSLSRVSDSKPGSRTGNLSVTNKTVETERRRTRDEVEERMEAVLLLAEPGQDEEGGQSQRADNVGQRRLQHN